MELPAAIGRYEVEEVVGQGGMGRVLRARDSVLGRRVAIKIIRDDLGLPPEVKEAVVARMRQEARAAAAVSHPNMVTLHDMGEEEPFGLYLVFEYVDGPTLRQAIDDASPDARTPSLRLKIGAGAGREPGQAELEVPRGALEPKEVVRIAREVAGALDRAHAAGVIHRDIKPENVLLSDVGAKITDFGIARMPDSTLTLQSTVMGTPAYSAPESLSRGEFSPRSDQFSLACMLYEALTGERAFPGDDGLAVAAKVATEDPVPLRSVGGLLDRASAVMLRGLAKDPARRFGSCGELAAALEDALAPVIEQTPARAEARDALRETAKVPESAVQVVGPPAPAVRRRRVVAVGAVAAVVVVAAVLFGLGGKRDRVASATALPIVDDRTSPYNATPPTTAATTTPAPSSSAAAPRASVAGAASGSASPKPRSAAPAAAAASANAHPAPSPTANGAWGKTDEPPVIADAGTSPTLARADDGG